MGLGGVAIATLPSVICAKLMFSDGLGGNLQKNRQLCYFAKDECKNFCYE